MAAAHCATADFNRRHPFSTASFIPRRPIFIVSSISSPYHTKHTKRKNYLRPKILKTLTKPLVPKLPSIDPAIPIDSVTCQTEIEVPEETDVEEFDKSEDRENKELIESELSDSSGVIPDGSADIFCKYPVLKYGLWLVGAFVFQSVCAVWVLGSAEFGKNEVFQGSNDVGILGLDENEKNKSKLKLFLNGDGNAIVGLENGAVYSVNYVDEVEMERKIEEIRSMAKEARASEKRELNGEGNDFGDGKFTKSGIEKEVDGRLTKLQKKLGNANRKFPVSSVGILRPVEESKNGVEKAKLGEKEGNGALMFKKNYKFKGLEDLDEKPKGFLDLDNDSFKNSKQKLNLEKEDDSMRSGNDNDDRQDLGSGKQQGNLAGGGSKGSDLVHLDKDNEKKGTLEVTTSLTSVKLVKEKGTRKHRKNGDAKPKLINGIAQDKNHTVEAVKSRRSKEESMQLRESNGNKSLNRIGNSQSGKNFEENISESETDFWWLKLPYVLGIAMHRGHDGERGHGLYTLKNTSDAEGDLSHTVAFEDRRDASNFCYLLQSFFKDLKNFGADIVPLKVKELNEAVKLHSMRVVVVKKGQLQLYAGQSLADAEMALRALVK